MQLKPGSHIHLIGICGTAMASLAGLFKDSGYKVTGSDQNVYPPMSTQLQQLGIPIQEGYKAEHLTPRPDFVIVGNVVRRDNAEAVELMRAEIPYTSLPKALGEYVIADRNSVVVAGTHGKTTTTSMMAVVAEKCQPGFGYLIGGIPENFSRSFKRPENNWFIIEGDEYDTAFFDKVPKFIHYKPKYVILTSIEFDHADIYKDLDHVKAAFRRLIELIPEDGILLAQAEDANIASLLPAAKCKVLTYGVTKGDYRVVERSVFEGRNHFAVEHKGRKEADIAIKAPGEYNALNALAVYALAKEMGWPTGGILQGLADFKGVKRRQQVLGEPGGVKIIEDFAHHPTAVEKTIAAIREQYLGTGRLFALFEPRSATSRRKIFQKDYVRALSQADAVLIATPYDQSRIDAGERFSSDELVRDLQDLGHQAEEFTNVDDMVAVLKKRTQPGDVVLVMSNGAFGGIYQKLL